MKDDGPALTPDLLLTAYATGIFPMAERRGDPEIFWVDPRLRGVMPLDGFHVSRSLARRLRKGRFKVTVDKDFAGVVQGCADRDETWINDTIFSLYDALFRSGHAHSVEVWSEDKSRLIGGVYGVALGAAFFGESMFSRETDASKIALAFLVDRLRVGGFKLLDTQFLTPHLASLGGIEISRRSYRRQLAEAMRQSADFHRQGRVPPAQDVVQRSGQTS
ncbi:leucyl/phenylalanyl-tRNA--protein transferase [Histidinibacterium aquaticum]|uniref:Leucyl/phenylalanyl-tRNA--protein transferase n=1 Tax=Histidinibacterium aquaticum TaxID=2613962 RepID=A0A5J5GCE2_9RHOB|nr:leucyl/phenylalanyl-tRNA--protein transferase [Histidinibacterium aquaticum]KAA9005640.1 leucyl/phenylalanyl-tRNA--protein transferase [Histidinibacterium aquaticum]